MELTETQRAVLGRGYCVLHINTTKWTCSDLKYQEWADLLDANMLRHEKSCLMPDGRFDVCWERYRVTKSGKVALEDTP